MQNLEDYFRLSYRKFDEIFPLITCTTGEIVGFKQRKYPKEPNKYREYQKLFGSCGNQNWTDALREKCLNMEFFWSVFSCIRTEYRNLQSKSAHPVQIQENTDQRKILIWTIFTL